MKFSNYAYCFLQNENLRLVGWEYAATVMEKRINCKHLETKHDSSESLETRARSNRVEVNVVIFVDTNEVYIQIFVFDSTSRSQKNGNVRDRERMQVEEKR